MVNRIIQAAVVATILFASSSIHATVVYNYERGAGVFGGSSGLSYDSITASYDTGSQDFSFTVDYNGTTADGGWLVISPGANPKGQTDELGIAYFDAASSNVWVYAYNGANNYSSHTTTNLLGFFAGGYTTVNDVATLAFNTAGINATLETGFSFGERIGIWFHPSSNLNSAGDANGLLSFNASGNGWLDTSFDGNCDNANTGCIRQVPEPTSLALFALGVLLILGSSRHARKRVLNQC